MKLHINQSALNHSSSYTNYTLTLPSTNTLPHSHSLSRFFYITSSAKSLAERGNTVTKVMFMKAVIFTLIFSNIRKYNQSQWHFAKKRNNENKLILVLWTQSYSFQSELTDVSNLLGSVQAPLQLQVIHITSTFGLAATYQAGTLKCSGSFGWIIYRHCLLFSIACTMISSVIQYHSCHSSQHTLLALI